MILLKYVSVVVVSELSFILGFLIFEFLHQILKLTLVVTGLYRRSSVGKDLFHGIWTGFGASSVALIVGLSIAKAFGLDSIWVFVAVFAWPLLAEIHDVYQRLVTGPVRSGCLIRNLHGAMKTPSQRAMFTSYRINYEDEFPEKTEDELFALSYNQVNIVFGRMFYGEVIGAGLAIWVIIPIMH